MEALATPLQAMDEQFVPEQPSMGIGARIGNTIRGGYDAIMDRVDNLAFKGKALIALGGIAFVGTQAAELAVNADTVGATENVPTLAGATSLPGAPESGILASTQSVSSGIELNNNRHYLDGSSPVPIGAVPGEPTDPGAGGNTAPTSPPEATPTDPKEVKQACIDAALAKPKIVKAELLHTGNFDHTPLELYYFSDRYQPWPTMCKGLYGNGSQARGQAFHNGHWVTMANWRNVNISDNGNGNWPGDIANLRNLEFPVYRARIQLRSNIVDLSVSMNPNKPWKPQHPTIAKTHFPPISVDILPHQSKAR